MCMVGSLPNRSTRKNRGAMADKEFIIGLLERVRRRVRSEQRFKIIYAILSLALIFPVFLKLIDLFSPLKGLIVVVLLGVWAIATTAWLVRRSRVQVTLDQAAESLDRQARLQDQMKTAWWFIDHPSPSESGSRFLRPTCLKSAYSPAKFRTHQGRYWRYESFSSQ